MAGQVNKANTRQSRTNATRYKAQFDRTYKNKRRRIRKEIERLGLRLGVELALEPDNESRIKRLKRAIQLRDAQFKDLDVRYMSMTGRAK